MFTLGKKRGPERLVQSGVDQGGDSSSFHFMVGIDVLTALLDVVLGVEFVGGRMDDISAATYLLGAVLFQVGLHQDAIPMTIEYHACWETDQGKGASPSHPQEQTKRHDGWVQHYAAWVEGPQRESYCYSHEKGAILAAKPWGLACSRSTELLMVTHREHTQDEIACEDGAPWGPGALGNKVIIAA